MLTTQVPSSFLGPSFPNGLIGNPGVDGVLLNGFRLKSCRNDGTGWMGNDEKHPGRNYGSGNE
jgi:hypothetical protein